MIASNAKVIDHFDYVLKLKDPVLFHATNVITTNTRNFDTVEDLLSRKQNATEQLSNNVSLGKSESFLSIIELVLQEYPELKEVDKEMLVLYVKNATFKYLAKLYPSVWVEDNNGNFRMNIDPYEIDPCTKYLEICSRDLWSCVSSAISLYYETLMLCNEVGSEEECDVHAKNLYESTVDDCYLAYDNCYDASPCDDK